MLANANNGDASSVKSECNLTKVAIDISEKALLNYNITQQSLMSWLSEDHSQLYEPPENDSFSNNMTTTDRWLTAMGLAFLYDMFVIYIIKMYFMTFLTLLTFNPKTIDESYFWANDTFFLTTQNEVTCMQIL